MQRSKGKFLDFKPDEIPLISRSNDNNSKKLMDFEFQEELFKNTSTCLQSRKLREALIASKRIDDFTIKVYEASVDIAIKEKNLDELSKTLVVLVSFYKQIKSVRELEFTHLYLLLLICRGTDMKDFVKMIKSIYCDVSRMTKLYNAIQQRNYYHLHEAYTSFISNEIFVFDIIIDEVRSKLLKTFKRCYFSLPVAHLVKYLLFPSDVDCISYLQESNLHFDSATVILKSRK